MDRRPIAYVLTATGVGKSRHGKRVLHDLDLHVRAGEIIGLLGSNGVGKSTLMGVLAGDFRPDEGAITLGGAPYEVDDRDEGRARGVGYVRQRLQIDPELTVAQALFRRTPLAEASQDELRGQAAELLAETGIRIDPDAVMGELVRTEQGIIEALRMLAEDAQLVIMDEVASTFNVDEIADLHLITRLLTDRGKSIIYISHRLHEVVAVADRIAVLRGGAVTVEIDPRRVSLEDLAAEMHDYDAGERPDRQGHLSEEIALSTRFWATDLGPVELQLHRGEVLGLVGPRRSGVDEVAAVVAGRRPATFDHFVLYGRDRAINGPADATALRIAYVSSEEQQTRETIAVRMLGGRQEGADGFRGEVRQLRQVVDTVNDLHIQTTGIHTPMAELSGGNAQLLTLTRSLSEDHDILVLDQPTRGLDVMAKERVWSGLAAHTAAGRSAILVSTEIDELLGWCDRIGFVRDGHLYRIDPVGALDRATIADAMRDGV